MQASKNSPSQLSWALPSDMAKLPPSIVELAHGTAHYAVLTLGLSVTASALLLAGSSSLATLPLVAGLASGLALYSNQTGFFGPARATLVLAAAGCSVALLSSFTPSALDAFALAPAALIFGVRGRDKPAWLLGALVIPLGLVVLLRQSGLTQAPPPLLYALGPICAAALVVHAAWRMPLVTPVQQAVDASKPALKPAPVVHRQAPAPGAPLRVLVVDDIPVNRLVVQRMLQAKGLTVLEAGSGLEALEVLENNEVDLVFLDLHMPGLDGIEVARRIRARGDRVPLVALTADSVAGTREACLAAGMDAFLNKPAPPQVLFQLVEGLTILQHKAAS